jgi:TolA-binding protein
MNLEDNYGAKKTNVNFAAQTEIEMEKTLETTVDLAEKTMDEKDAVKKEEKMQEGDSSRLDSLEEQVNQLRVDIAQVFEALKEKKEEMAVEVKDEEAARKKLEEKDQIQGMPNYGGPQNMSAQKKFTGAPVEEKVDLGGLVKSNKLGTTIGSVLAKMNNSKF